MDVRNLAIDAAALVFYLAVANPALTGIGLHEWLGLGALAVLFVHLLVHMDWCLDALRASLRRPTWARTGNLAVDVLALVAFVVTTASGLLMSGTVLPALGLYAGGYYFWDPLHAIAAKVLLALLVVHVAAHWKWFANVLKRGKGIRHDEKSSE